MFSHVEADNDSLEQVTQEVSSTLPNLTRQSVYAAASRIIGMNRDHNIDFVDYRVLKLLATGMFFMYVDIANSQIRSDFVGSWEKHGLPSPSKAIINFLQMPQSSWCGAAKMKYAFLLELFPGINSREAADNPDVVIEHVISLLSDVKELSLDEITGAESEEARLISKIENYLREILFLSAPYRIEIDILNDLRNWVIEKDRKFELSKEQWALLHNPQTEIGNFYSTQIQTSAFFQNVDNQARLVVGEAEKRFVWRKGK